MFRRVISVFFGLFLVLLFAGTGRGQCVIFDQVTCEDLVGPGDPCSGKSCDWTEIEPARQGWPAVWVYLCEGMGNTTGSETANQSVWVTVPIVGGQGVQYIGTGSTHYCSTQYTCDCSNFDPFVGGGCGVDGEGTTEDPYADSTSNGTIMISCYWRIRLTTWVFDA